MEISPPNINSMLPINGQLIGDISLPLKRSENKVPVSILVSAYNNGKAASW